MSWNGNELLIGKTVTGMEIDGTRSMMTLTCADGSIVQGIAEGDCCSVSWIEDIDDESVLIGHTITSAEDIPMPDLGSVGTAHMPSVDSVSYYGLRIETEAGVCTIDYRNDSNGWYGGSLRWSVL